ADARQPHPAALEHRRAEVGRAGAEVAAGAARIEAVVRQRRAGERKQAERRRDGGNTMLRLTPRHSRMTGARRLYIVSRLSVRAPLARGARTAPPASQGRSAGRLVLLGGEHAREVVRLRVAGAERRQAVAAL